VLQVENIRLLIALPVFSPEAIKTTKANPQLSESAFKSLKIKNTPHIVASSNIVVCFNFLLFIWCILFTALQITKQFLTFPNKK
jgi:hypothetical protein